MPPISLAPRSARYLSFAEREEIAILRAQGAGVRDIARRLRRAPSTVSRELHRNAALLHESELARTDPDPQFLHRPMRYDIGLPSPVI